MVVKRILFPVDDSVYPRKAMQSIGMFHTLDPELEVTLLHVVDSANSLIGGSQREELNAELNEAGMRLLAPFL